MFILFLTVLVCSGNQIGAVLTHGVTCTSPTNTAVKMLGVRHDGNDQEAIKRQVGLIDAYVASHQPDRMVMLVEEPIARITQAITSSKRAHICNDVRLMTKQYGIQYENIDPCSASIAALYVLNRSRQDVSIHDAATFGFGESSIRADEVTFDDLFKEKEDVVERIQHRFGRLSEENSQTEKVYGLLNGFRQTDATVAEFCSTAGKDKVKSTYLNVLKTSAHLLEQHAKKLLMHHSADKTVMLAAGADHVRNLKNELNKQAQWKGFETYLKSSPSLILTDYQVKSMLGTLNTWDYVKSFIC